LRGSASGVCGAVGWGLAAPRPPLPALKGPRPQTPDGLRVAAVVSPLPDGLPGGRFEARGAVDVWASGELPDDIVELWPRLVESAAATGVHPHLFRPDDPFFLQALEAVDAVRLESVLAADFAEYRQRRLPSSRAGSVRGSTRGHRALAARPGTAVREPARTGGRRVGQDGRCAAGGGRGAARRGRSGDPSIRPRVPPGPGPRSRHPRCAGRAGLVLSTADNLVDDPPTPFPSTPPGWSGGPSGGCGGTER